MMIITSNFFKISDDEDFFLTFNQTDDECAKCQGSYNQVEEWLCCPVCHQ